MNAYLKQGDKPLTADQLKRRHRQLERQHISPTQETYLNRVQWGATLNVREPSEGEAAQIEKFRTTMVELETLAAEMRAVNQFNAQLEAYRIATARLARYPLAEGRAAIYADQPTGEFNEQGEPITQFALVSESIGPLPATIEQPVYDPETGEQTGTETVPNPLVEQDQQERTTAQSVIDSTPQEVKDYV